MTIFLEEYQNNFDAEKKFLEESLSYAIHDYLENNPRIKNKELKEIAMEIFLLEKNGKTKRFIEKLIKNNDTEFVRQINPYLLPYLN